jgi:hypothetical protein
LLTAGPVCLYRIIRRRAIAHELQRSAAIDEAIHIHQEGVWPPAPAQMMQESPAEKGE